MTLTREEPISLPTVWRQIVRHPANRAVYATLPGAVTQAAARLSTAIAFGILVITGVLQVVEHVVRASVTHVARSEPGLAKEIIFLIGARPILVLFSEFFAAAVVALPATQHASTFRQRFRVLLFPWAVVLVVIALALCLGTIVSGAMEFSFDADVGPAICASFIANVFVFVYMLTVAVTGLSTFSKQRRWLVFGLYFISLLAANAIIWLAQLALLGRLG